MKDPREILPPKLAFTRLEKQKGGVSGSYGFPAISLAEREDSPVYINAVLALLLATSGIKKVFVHYDQKAKAIALEPTDNVNGYTLSANRGSSAIYARLRKVLPCGRYLYREEESTNEMLVFRLSKVGLKIREL